MIDLPKDENVCNVDAFCYHSVKLYIDDDNSIILRKLKIQISAMKKRMALKEITMEHIVPEFQNFN